MQSCNSLIHYCDVIMNTIASKITGISTICSTAGADQRKQQSPSRWLLWEESTRWPVDSPHKGPATHKMFPFDVVIMMQGKQLWRTCVMGHVHLGRTVGFCEFLLDYAQQSACMFYEICCKFIKIYNLAILWFWIFRYHSYLASSIHKITITWEWKLDY